MFASQSRITWFVQLQKRFLCRSGKWNLRRNKFNLLIKTSGLYPVFFKWQQKICKKWTFIVTIHSYLVIWYDIFQLILLHLLKGINLLVFVIILIGHENPFELIFLQWHMDLLVFEHYVRYTCGPRWHPKVQSCYLPDFVWIWIVNVPIFRKCVAFYFHEVCINTFTQSCAIELNYKNKCMI